MISTSTNCSSLTRSGDPITLFHNDVEIATIPKYFKNFEHCIDYNDVDIENDNFRLVAGGSDGVCITSLHVYFIVNNIVNSKQILVGKYKNLTSFEFDQPGVCRDDKFKAASLTIRNGKVVNSTCGYEQKLTTVMSVEGSSTSVPTTFVATTTVATTTVPTTSMSIEQTTGEESTTLTTLSTKSITQTADSMDVITQLINLNPIIFVEVNPVMIPSTATRTTSTIGLTDKTTVTDPILASMSSSTKVNAKTTIEVLSRGFK